MITRYETDLSVHDRESAVSPNGLFLPIGLRSVAQLFVTVRRRVPQISQSQPRIFARVSARTEKRNGRLRIRCADIGMARYLHGSNSRAIVVKGTPVNGLTVDASSDDALSPSESAWPPVQPFGSRNSLIVRYRSQEFAHVS